jgi:hypothetical protein
MALGHGVDICTLADRLGHSDPAFTLRKYVHRVPNAGVKLGAALRNIYEQSRLTRCATSVRDDLRESQKAHQSARCALLRRLKNTAAATPRAATCEYRWRPSHVVR